MEAFESLGSLKDPSRLGSWLRSVTIHKCVDYLRSRPKTLEVDSSQMYSSNHGPPAEAQRRELREQVLAAISRLSKTQRETTTLFYINSYSIAEVADMQEVPVGTVKRRLHDAREKLKEELIGMVENVLKCEAPKEDFAARVLDILARFTSPEIEDRIPWRDVYTELRRIGPRGIEGYVRAVECPHSHIRNAAVHMSRFSESPDTRETIVRLTKAGLKDPNKRVRRSAVDLLLAVDVPAERRREEFVPLAIPLLWDVSKRVRKRAAYALSWHPDEVPLEPVLQALIDERDPDVRIWKIGLLGEVLNAHK